MNKQEQQQKADNLLITVQDNPTQGACSITEHFEEEWKSGIPLIDTIKTTILNDAYEDLIRVTDQTGKELFMLRSQKGLWLSHLQGFLISYLEIEIS